MILPALKISEVLPKYQTFKALFPCFMDKTKLEFWQITYWKVGEHKSEWKVNFDAKSLFLGGQIKSTILILNEKE